MYDARFACEFLNLRIVDVDARLLMQLYLHQISHSNAITFELQRTLTHLKLTPPRF